MEDRIQKIEKQLGFYRIYTCITSVMLLVFLFFSFKSKNEATIIRTKGIVIVDSLGKDRILIGAPIPASQQRIRTNYSLAEASWGKENPKYFKSWYNHLNHAANGIVFLDESGYDRLVIGNSIPDPNIGKRVGKSTGLVINDEKGYERSGYGLLNHNGKNSVNLGMDHENGTEGVVIGIMEDGTAGIYTNSNEKSLFIGNATPNSFVTGLDRAFFGLIVKDTLRTKYNFNLLEK